MFYVYMFSGVRAANLFMLVRVSRKGRIAKLGAIRDGIEQFRSMVLSARSLNLTCQNLALFRSKRHLSMPWASNAFAT